jgi:hypothetical protein
VRLALQQGAERRYVAFLRSNKSTL